MVELGPELAPEGVTLAEALPILLRLAPFVVALGFIVFVDGFTRALLGTAEGAVSWVPVVGKWAKKPIHQVEQKITNILGTAERKLDSYIAHSFHQLGVLTRQLGRQIEGLALDIYHVSSAIGGLLSPQAIRQYVTSLLHPIRTAQAILRKLVATLHTAERILRHAYADVLLPRIHGLEHTAQGVLVPDIAGLRKRTKSLEKEYAKLQAKIRAKPWLVVGVAYIGALTYALRKMGLGCLTGRNAKRLVPRLCKIPTGLVDFLTGLGFGLFAFSHICDLIELLTPIAQRVLPPLVEVLAKPAAALCGGKHKAAPPLALRTTKLPDVPNPLAID